MIGFKEQVQDKLTQKPVKLIYEILRSKNQEFIGAKNHRPTVAVFLQTWVDGWWKQFQSCHLEKSE